MAADRYSPPSSAIVLSLTMDTDTSGRFIEDADTAVGNVAALGATATVCDRKPLLSTRAFANLSLRSFERHVPNAQRRQRKWFALHLCYRLS